MIYISFSIVVALILATVPVARCEQTGQLFEIGFAVDESYHYEPECTADELSMIKASSVKSIVKRGNAFFGTAENDLHLNGDFVDIDEATFTAGKNPQLSSCIRGDKFETYTHFRSFIDFFDCSRQ